MLNPKSDRTLFKRSIAPGINIDVKKEIETQLKLSTLHQNSRTELSSSLQRAISSKLIRDDSVQEIRKDETQDEWFNRRADINSDYFLKTAKRTATNITDANTILDSLPDIELTKEIVISSILSPNDIMSSELFYSNTSSLFGSVTPHLIKVIKDYFNDTYKINRKLRTIIEKALFTEGSYTWLILPETSIDHVINSNMKISHESLKNDFTMEGDYKSLGILGSSNSNTTSNIFIGIESHKTHTINNTVGVSEMMVQVTDNFNALKQPWLHEYKSKQSINEIIGKRLDIGLEDFNPMFGIDSKEDDDNIYPDRQATMRQIVSIVNPDSLEKENVGHPAIINPPAESVIPVFRPSDPSSHVGYFIAVDEFGNPLKLSVESSQFDQMRNSSESIKTLNGAMLSQSASASIGGNDARDAAVDPRTASQLYANLIEQDLIARLKNGVYQSNIGVSESSDVYSMMFWRACRQLRTRLIYVPIELTTYLAYDYHNNGVGRSILDKTKSLASLRVVNQMAEALAGIKSSIDHRTLDIKLDPNDPHPMKTIEKFVHEYQRATMTEAPFGMYSMTDITDSIQSAGVHVKVSGHESVPDMGMEVSNNNLGYTKPDSDMSEKLQKQHIMGIGAPPEAITSTEQIQFAAAVIAQNAFFAKINLIRQEVTSEALSDFIMKYTKNSSVLRKQLVTIINSNLPTLQANGIDKNYSAEALALVFIKHLKVELPKPDTAKIEMQLKAFSDYADAFDKLMESFINENMFSEKWVGSELSSAVGDLTGIIKSHYLREYAMKNNFMPELFNLISNSEGSENYDVFEQFETYIEGLLPSIKTLLIKRMQKSNHLDGVIISARDLISGGDEENSNDSPAPEETDSSDGDEGDSDEFGFDDNFDTGDDSSGDSNDSDETNDNNDDTNDSEESEENDTDDS